MNETDTPQHNFATELARLAAASPAGGAQQMHVTVQIPTGALRDLEALVDFLRTLPLAVRQMGGR